MKLKMHEKIKTLRKINDLTQEQMAEKLDLSLNGYRDIESGKVKTISNDKIEQILQMFDMDYFELLSVGEVGRVCLVGDGSFLMGDRNLVHLGNIGNNSSSNSQKDIAENEQKLLHEIEMLKMVVTHKEETIGHLQEKIASLEKIIALIQTRQS